MDKTDAKPAAVCTHRRYTVDVREQTGRCIDCGAEGRMQFVVGDPVAAERDKWAKVLAESCAEERSQMWESGPGGGCSRAIAAEAEIERLRTPLTAQQLDELIEEHVGGAELADGEYSAMVMFAAAVERAHGIGV